MCKGNASKDPKRVALGKSKPNAPFPRTIHDAAKAARAYVQDFVKGLAPEVAKALLMDWLNFIEKKAIVIWVEVPDDRAAYTIFETMN